MRLKLSSAPFALMGEAFCSFYLSRFFLFIRLSHYTGQHANIDVLKPNFWNF